MGNFFSRECDEETLFGINNDLIEIPIYQLEDDNHIEWSISWYIQKLKGIKIFNN